MTSTATATQTRLEVGQSREWIAGRHAIAVARVDVDAWRVVVLDGRGLSIPAYTVTFDSAAGNLEVGMTGRRAAWIYVQQRIAEFEAAAERPADLLARTAADYAALDARRLSAAQLAAIRTHRDGRISHGHGVTVATLRALAKAHLGRLVYHTEGMRRRVVGLDLNGSGRRLADHLTSNLAAA